MHEVFAEFHRRERRAALPRRLALALVALVIGAGAVWGVAAQPPAATGAVLAGPPPTSAPAATTASPVTPVSPVSPGEPAGVAPLEPAETPAAPTVPEQQHVSIEVAIRGFQAELDRCLWVRMDVGAVAPIVGAHNYCDGDLVLALNTDDLVTIAGTDLDGDYQVTGSRDAHAGDDAATAPSGLTADLLLQTCYWSDADGLRLVTLRRVDLSLPPTPAA